jgi:pimeloyl-ACP methyl ester carboxylesterase
VRSLVLLDTAADHEPWLNLPKYKLIGLLSRALGARAVSGQVMKVMFAKSFLEDAAPARAALRQEMLDALAANDLRGSLRATDGVLMRKPVESELPRIRCPTLVISGAEDSAVVPARARRTADLITGARFMTIPRAGHTSAIEEPDAVNAALGGFWAASA